MIEVEVVHKAQVPMQRHLGPREKSETGPGLDPDHPGDETIGGMMANRIDPEGDLTRGPGLGLLEGRQADTRRISEDGSRPEEQALYKNIPVFEPAN